MKFKCLKCGECCKWPGYVRLTVKEDEKIATYLDFNIQDFIEKYTCITSDRRNLSLIERDDHSCVFFDREKSNCMIYKVRPKQCRQFPKKWNFEGWENYCKSAKS
jgi:Fe-S-cluster containining protein